MKGPACLFWQDRCFLCFVRGSDVPVSREALWDTANHMGFYLSFTAPCLFDSVLQRIHLFLHVSDS